MGRLHAAHHVLNLRRYFDLREDTGLCAINYLDRYIVRTPNIDTLSLRLAACATLLIAAKFFDRKLPAPSELAFAFDSSASLRDRDIRQRQIVNMELVIVSALEWKLHIYSPSSFVPLLCDACEIHCTATTYNQIKALIRLSTVECVHERHSPAIIAAAAVLGAFYAESLFERLSSCSRSIAHALAVHEDSVHSCMFELVRHGAGGGQEPLFV